MTAHEYYLANRETILANGRKWRDANPEKARAAVKKWRDANQDKARAICRDYKASSGTGCGFTGE